jgi:hypothetical protein
MENCLQYASGGGGGEREAGGSMSVYVSNGV